MVHSGTQEIRQIENVSFVNSRYAAGTRRKSMHDYLCVEPLMSFLCMLGHSIR